MRLPLLFTAVQPLHPFVIFVGDRPTQKNVRQDTPFVGTRSYAVFLTWMAKMDLDIRRIALVNSYDMNGLPTNLVMHDIYSFPKVVCLGEKAAERLARDYPEVEFFGLPHPSGRNLKLNDKRSIMAELKACKEYIYG